MELLLNIITLTKNNGITWQYNITSSTVQTLKKRAQSHLRRFYISHEQKKVGRQWRAFRAVIHTSDACRENRWGGISSSFGKTPDGLVRKSRFEQRYSNMWAFRRPSSRLFMDPQAYIVSRMTRVNSAPKQEYDQRGIFFAST